MMSVWKVHMASSPSCSLPCSISHFSFPYLGGWLSRQQEKEEGSHVHCGFGDCGSANANLTSAKTRFWHHRHSTK